MAGDRINHQGTSHQLQPERQLWKALGHFPDQVRPFARIVGSGMETFNSSARLFHLCHFLKVTIAALTVGASVGHSNAVRMAFLSANPPGWYWTMPFAKIPNVEMLFDDTTSSRNPSGIAASRSADALLSNLDHLFCCNEAPGTGTCFSRSRGVFNMWELYHSRAVETIWLHHSSLVADKSDIGGCNSSNQSAKSIGPDSDDHSWSLGSSTECLTTSDSSESSPPPFTNFFWISCMPSMSLRMTSKVCGGNDSPLVSSGLLVPFPLPLPSSSFFFLSSSSTPPRAPSGVPASSVAALPFGVANTASSSGFPPPRSSRRCRWLLSCRFSSNSFFTCLAGLLSISSTCFSDATAATASKSSFNFWFSSTRILTWRASCSFSSSLTFSEASTAWAFSIAAFSSRALTIFCLLAASSYLWFSVFPSSSLKKVGRGTVSGVSNFW